VCPTTTHCELVGQARPVSANGSGEPKPGSASARQVAPPSSVDTTKREGAGTAVGSMPLGAAKHRRAEGQDKSESDGVPTGSDSTCQVPEPAPDVATMPSLAVTESSGPSVPAA
jgi:hypothetical protein